MPARTELVYEDNLGVVRVSCEDKAANGLDLLVDSIPDRGGRSREQIAGNIQRALAHAGWTVELR
jgi:hypothetical protein